MHDLDARVADQYVDSAVCRDHCGHAGDHRRLVGDIHRDRHRPPVRVPDLRRHGFGSVHIQIGNRQPGALAGINQRNLTANAACRTGDERYSVVQFHEVIRVLSGNRPGFEFIRLRLDGLLTQDSKNGQR